MSVWDCLGGALTYLGLWKKSANLLFLGLDNAGKTTLIHMLKDEKLRGHEPPLYYDHKEELMLWGKNIAALDLSGRLSWRDSDYFPIIDAVVFVIDAQDKYRFEESKKKLDSVLAKLGATVPVLVLGNKCDNCLAVSENTLKTAFGLHDKITGKGVASIEELSPKRPLELFMCSAFKKQGYEEGFKWLIQYLP